MNEPDLGDRIVEILTKDARVSNREVARMLGITESSIRKRLKKLEASGSAKVTAIVHPQAVGLSVSAWLRVATHPAAVRAVATFAAAADCVSFVGHTTGRYNLTLLASARSREDLANFVHQLRSQDGVHSLDTIENVAIVKHRLDVVAINPPTL